MSKTIVSNDSITQRAKGADIGLALTALLIAVIGVLSWVALEKIEKQTKRDIGSTLMTVLNTTHESLQGWADDQQEDTRQIASRPDIIILVKELLEAHRKKDDLKNYRTLQKLRKTIRPILESHQYLGFFVISPDRINIASMHDENMGEVNSLKDHGNQLDKIFRGETQVILPMRSDVALPDISGRLSANEPTMFVGAPVFDNNGEVIAAFTIRINPYLNFTRIVQIARTGETGDTYAFNKSGRLITESRFDHQLRQIGLVEPYERSIISLKLLDPGGNMLEGFMPDVKRENLPLTRMAKSAVSGETGIDTEGYRDYRGVPVVGAWLWDYTLDYGLAFEIDVDEAYKSFYSTRRTVISVLTVTVVLFLGLSMTILRSYGQTDNANRRLQSEIIERKHAEETLRESEAKMRAILETVYNAIITIDQKGIILSVNPATEKMFGYSTAYIVGKNVKMLMPEPYCNNHDSYIKEYLKTGKKKVVGKWQEVRGLRSDGSVFPAEINVGDIWVNDARIFTGIIHDITERKKTEDILKRLSSIDGLTGLANRRTFDEVLEREWRRALRGNDLFSVIMLDIDYFKKFNDAYGHQGGDECLKKVANAFKGVARRPGDLAARYGGEEFSAILPMADKEKALNIAEKIREGVESLKIPHKKSNTGEYVTISIGVATVEANVNLTPQGVIETADKALYRAKRKGRNKVIAL